MFNKLFTDSVFDALVADRIRNCDFSGCTGNLNLSSTTSLIDVDMIDSAADVDTSLWTTYDLTLKGIIQNTFTTPDETTIGVAGAITVNVNRDGTTDLVARIELTSEQQELNMAAYKYCVSTLFIIPDSGGNNINSIVNPVIGREYKIVSNDVSSLLSLDKFFGNIIYDAIVDNFFGGNISWNNANAINNKIFIENNGTNTLILAKSQTYI
jgi:hypothetical protein